MYVVAALHELVAACAAQLFSLLPSNHTETSERSALVPDPVRAEVPLPVLSIQDASGTLGLTNMLTERHWAV